MRAKLQQIERFNLELLDLQERVRTLKGSFYETYTRTELEPETFKFKQEIDPNAPDEFNLEPDTWKEVEKQILVPRNPTIGEKNQLADLAQQIKVKERQISQLKDSIQVAKVMETVSDVISYLDPKTHKNDIANLKYLQEQHFSDLHALKSHISGLSRGQSSVTRELYEAIQRTKGSDVDDQLSKVSEKIEERNNVHKTERSFNFKSFKEQIPRVNIDEDSSNENNDNFTL